eukprot:Hpha_TRINITY_DN15311_c2_g1::TRINITY_DN15311_c2_g1_i1::g.88628::m.88628
MVTLAEAQARVDEARRELAQLNAKQKPQLGQREQALHRQRLQAVERELSTGEDKRQEQDTRRRKAESDLERAEEEMQEEQDRRASIQKLRPDVDRLQEVLRALVSDAKGKQIPEQLPHQALDRLRALAREREHELSNTEKQLREVNQIITMKQQREQELVKETDQRISSLKESLNQEVLSFVERCQRERTEMQERIEQMRQENKDQIEALKAKNHMMYRPLTAEEKRSVIKRDQPVRSQISRKPSGRAPAKKPAPKSADSADGALVLPAGMTLARGAVDQDVAVASLGRSMQEKEEIKRRLREEENRMAKMEVDHQRLKRELDSRIASEKKQSEQFEKENQKLEQQAEHLEKMLKQLKAGSRDMASQRPKSPRPVSQGTPRPRITS